MKIVIAPDSFKECLSAQEVGLAIQHGLARVWPNAEYRIVPVADGGEGSAQSLVDASQGHFVTLKVTGPLGQSVQAKYGLTGDKSTAIIEMAEASGLHLVSPAQRQALDTTSYGTGELIKHALDSGIRKLIIGLGGSATNDAGVGMLSALGARFIDASDEPIVTTGRGLSDLCQIDTSSLDPRLQQSEILVACDVNNPLCGDNGASAVFGPQKGADAKEVALLDRNLKHFSELTKQVTQRDVLHASGSGAAGGMGAALLAYSNAILKPGVEIVLNAVGLESQLRGADLVITGEGRIDSQTVQGKTPMGVAQVAKLSGIPVIALCGCTGDGYQAVYECGIDAVFSVVPRAMELPVALAEAEINISDVAENVARVYSM